ncbi:hypothetical protein [Paenibacillus spongiae]|uniref:ABC transporter permease n=1 Tax=Paenibacillus spongiae TaxID=2909671 RepID=A0ABY5S4B6_9BACL|nr:hypothetical protein [Paenibacillus spongiae]UVI27573.1 hypothetical protein L1F29_19080 [Paenibacillus spongiae]
MHAFRRLLLTELRNRRSVILVSMAALICLNVLLAALPLQFQYASHHLNGVMTLNIAVCYVYLFIVFLRCFSTWNDEWKVHSIYQLLTLPIPRVFLILYKYIAILVESFLYALIMAAGLIIQYRLTDGMLFRAEPLITFNAAKLLFIAQIVLFATCVIFLCFFCSLLGRVFSRFPLMIAFLAFLIGIIITILAVTKLEPTLMIMVLCAAFFGGCHYLLEKRIAIV